MVYIHIHMWLLYCGFLSIKESFFFKRVKILHFSSVALNYFKNKKCPNLDYNHLASQFRKEMCLLVSQSHVKVLEHSCVCFMPFSSSSQPPFSHQHLFKIHQIKKRNKRKKVRSKKENICCAWWYLSRFSFSLHALYIVSFLRLFSMPKSQPSFSPSSSSFTAYFSFYAIMYCSVFGLYRNGYG